MVETAGFTFTMAAATAGITPKALRGWMDRDQVKFPSLATRGEKGWQRFTMVDVLHLAIVGVIIKYDFRIEFADKIAQQIVGPITTDKGLPDTASTTRLKNLQITLHQAQRPDAFGPAIGELVPDSQLENCGEYLVVRPYRIYQEVCDRLSNANMYQIYQITAADIVLDFLHKKAAKRKKRAKKSKPPRRRKSGRNA